MSDTDSDEKSASKHDSKTKKKRQKSDLGGGGMPTKTYQFEISLSETNSENYTEVSFLDLVSREEQRLRKLAEAQQKNGDGHVGANLDPYASDDDDQLKALAASFEAKYGDKPKTKKIGKIGGKKRKHDYDHLGEGYDESDPFIDNSECFDEVVPQEITTAHGGFYINTGALEFKENKNAVFNLSSDDEKQPEEKKVKKAKKDPTKKQVQPKEIKEKKKPKIKVTDVKRKARIINTNPNIKGPGPKGPGAIVNNEGPKPKVELKKLEVKRVESPKLEKVVAPPTPVSTAPASAPPPRSPEKPVAKPADILNLEAQLEALNQSKTVEISKNESKALVSPKPVPKAGKMSTATIKKVKETPVSVPSSAPKSSIAELKLPPSVRVTKVEDHRNVPKLPVSNTSNNKMGWQNQVNFANQIKENPKAAIPVPAETKPKKTVQNPQANKPTTPKAQPTSNTIIQPVRAGAVMSPHSQRAGAVTSSSPVITQPQLLKTSSVSVPSSISASVDTSNMFQHDPKNILASAVTSMSSILGTTAPYFAQKLQQKPALDLSPRTVSSPGYARSVPGMKAVGSPAVSKVHSPSPAPASPVSSGRHSSPSGLYQPGAVRQSPAGSPAVTESVNKSPARPSSGQVTKLPTAPNAPAVDNINPQQVLTPEMRKSLLGLAENMINDIQKQNTSPISNLPKPSNVQSLPNAPKIQSLPKTHSLQQQQQQQSAYMSQFQNFAGQQQKKSSSYEISSLLNSQPLPQNQSRVQQSAQLTTRVPPGPPQDQALQLQRAGTLSQTNRSSPLTSTATLPGTQPASQIVRQSPQHQFSHQLVGAAGLQQQQQSIARQQQSVARQQQQQQQSVARQQQQQQVNQALLQQYQQNYYNLGGF